jgi:hypothetical protein
MNEITHNGQPGYWDGESMIITRWNDDGLPDMLFPADTPTYAPAAPSYRDNFKAEDLDTKCSEIEYQNRWGAS